MEQIRRQTTLNGARLSCCAPPERKLFVRAAWARELRKWAPFLDTVTYTGPGPSRDTLRWGMLSRSWPLFTNMDRSSATRSKLWNNALKAGASQWRHL